MLRGRRLRGRNLLQIKQWKIQLAKNLLCYHSETAYRILTRASLIGGALYLKLNYKKFLKSGIILGHLEYNILEKQIKGKERKW